MMRSDNMRMAMGKPEIPPMDDWKAQLGQTILQDAASQANALKALEGAKVPLRAWLRDVGLPALEAVAAEIRNYHREVKVSDAIQHADTITIEMRYAGHKELEFWIEIQLRTAVLRPMLRVWVEKKGWRALEIDFPKAVDQMTKDDVRQFVSRQYERSPERR